VYFYVIFVLETNTKTMELVRIITADSLESIDINNLGNHFTVEGNEPAIAMGLDSLSSDSQEGEVFYIYVEVDEKEINKEATKKSNEYYPLEKEVVTNNNTAIRITEIYNEAQEVVAENITGNTGERVHEWVM